MRLVAWLSGRRQINPERDTPAASVDVTDKLVANFIRDNLLDDEDKMYMHIDVFSDFAHDTEDRNLVNFVAQAAQFSGWIHVEDDNG